jgi:hypothetical protein
MILHLALCSLGAFAPPMPPPKAHEGSSPPATSAPASAPPSPTAPDAAPSAPAASPTPAPKPSPAQPALVSPGVALLAGGFARSLDLMRDVKTSSAPIARAASAIRSIAIEPAIEPKNFRFEAFQPATRRLDVVGMGGKQGARSTVLGSFELSGSSVVWRWNRVNVDIFGEALLECDAALPTVVMAILLEDGSSTYAAGAAVVHRAALQRQIPANVQLFKVPGRALALHVVDTDAWERKADGGATVLQSEGGTLRLSLDESTGMLTLLLQDPVSAELLAARRELEARRDELSRRKGFQREIVATEVAELEQRLRDLQAESVANKVPLPKFPRIVGVDHAGRVFAEVKVTAQ